MLKGNCFIATQGAGGTGALFWRKAPEALVGAALQPMHAKTVDGSAYQGKVQTLIAKPVTHKRRPRMMHASHQRLATMHSINDAHDLANASIPAC